MKKPKKPGKRDLHEFEERLVLNLPMLVQAHIIDGLEPGEAIHTALRDVDELRNTFAAGGIAYRRNNGKLELSRADVMKWFPANRSRSGNA